MVARTPLQDLTQEEGLVQGVMSKKGHSSQAVRLGLRPFHPPRGVLGPFGPKVGNGVENEFPGPSGPGVPKS